MNTSIAAPISDYAALRAQLLKAGLLDRRPVSFILKMIETLGLIIASVAFLFVVKSMALVIVSAIFAAFVGGQIGLLAHDAGHRQIFKNPKTDLFVGYTCSFFLGISFRRWNEKHNEHHAHPNREDMDPDINFPVLAFSEKQAKEKKGLFRFIVRHQALFFFPMLCFVSLSLRLDSVQSFFLTSMRRTWIDITIVIGHFTCYFALVFWLMPPLHAIIFILVHQAFFGLYLGLIFAPNHKGMPVLEKNAKIDFLREQVLTSRNIRSNALVDFWYGGLNFQIEHHLFPTMPRVNLRRARVIIKNFCLERGIPYYETGMIRSYCEIVRYMHHVSTFCRVPAMA